MPFSEKPQESQFRSRSTRKDSGFALFFVIWLCVAISLLVLETASDARITRMTALNDVELTSKRQLAIAGLEGGSLLALSQVPQSSSHRRQAPAPGNLPGIISMDWRFADRNMAISIEPEHGKIDVNTGDLALIAQALRNLAIADAVGLVERISTLRTQSQRRDRRYWRSESAAFPTLEAFASMPQLRSTPWDVISRYFTVRSQRPEPHAFLATAEVLAVLGAHRADLATHTASSPVSGGPHVTVRVTVEDGSPTGYPASRLIEITPGGPQPFRTVSERLGPR